MKVAWALGVGNWALRMWAEELTAIISFNDHQTIAGQCAIPSFQSNPY